MRLTGYLIIRNGSEVRWVKRNQNLDPNEVAIQVKIVAPDPPRIVAMLDIELPDPPPATAEFEVVEYEGSEE